MARNEPAMMEDDPGLAASPTVRYRLKWEEPLRNPGRAHPPGEVFSGGTWPCLWSGPSREHRHDIGVWWLDEWLTVEIRSVIGLVPAPRASGACRADTGAGDQPIASITFGGLSTIVSIPVVPPRGVPPRDGVGAAGDPSGGGSGEWLTVTVSWPGAGVAVVRAVGEIDMLTVRPWARTLDDTCRRLARHDEDPRRCGDGARRGSGRARLVCDLTGIEFFGVSGLAVLVETAALAARAEVALRVVADSRPVLRFLQIAGLDHSLCIDAHLLTAITHALRRRR
jgi:hypothetical protein